MSVMLSTVPRGGGSGRKVGRQAFEVSAPDVLSHQRIWLMAIVETTQSRSSKFPTPGVLLSLVAASFRSLFPCLGLVGVAPPFADEFLGSSSEG